MSPNDSLPTAPSGEPTVTDDEIIALARSLGETAGNDAHRAVCDLAWYARRLCADQPERYEVRQMRAGEETRLSDSVLRVLGLAASLSTERARMERERDAYRKAKQENDERFQIERDEARAEVSRLTSELDRVRGALAGLLQSHGCPEDGVPRCEECDTAARLAFGVTPDATTRRE